MRRPAILLSAMLLAGAAAAAAPDEKPPRPAAVLAAESTQVDAPVARWLETAWAAYKARFVVDGRVIDNVNGISHSEGQGYAMLIAARAADPAGFEAIWRWTKRELFIRPDGLAAWKWEPGANPRVTTPRTATS